MSNFFAIATVTATLGNLLEEIRDYISDASVTANPPDIANGGVRIPKLNIFLYHVSSNPAYRTEELPTRNPNGELIKVPRIALDLHYLLTAYGTLANDTIAHQIMALAIRILNENPILGRRRIENVVNATGSGLSISIGSPSAHVMKSDLANQIESIKISFQNLSVEELTKIWSSFFHTNYRLSVSYKATVVLLDSELQPKPTLPVKDRNIYVNPIRQPIIDKAEPQKLEWADDAKILVYGKNLRSSNTRIVFDDSVAVEVDTDNIHDDRISATIPTALLAGIHSIQVIHELFLGSPPTDHSGGLGSNTVPFVLCPRIISPLSKTLRKGDDLTVVFKPWSSPAQHITIIIGNRIIPCPVAARNNIDRVTVKIPDNFSTGAALIRIRIDGAESFLIEDRRETLENGEPNPSYLKYIQPNIIVKG